MPAPRRAIVEFLTVADAPIDRQTLREQGLCFAVAADFARQQAEIRQRTRFAAGILQRAVEYEGFVLVRGRLIEAAQFGLQIAERA
ncbi:MAG: hypothetical protein NVS3B28_18340 [Candidatus Velthaea sp.]